MQCSPSYNLKRTLFTSLIFLAVLISALGLTQPARAEGSKEMVASGTGKRALTEWRTDTTAGLYRRTFFRVYAQAGEYILMGSSAMGLGTADIVLYQEGQVSSSQITPAALAAITPTFRCSTGGLGVLRSTTSALTRAMELQGATRNGGADGGYIPCVYQAPTTGTYWVGMYGPDGPAATARNGFAGSIALPNITGSVANTGQNTGISVWDITVRSGSATTGTNKPGRVYVDYLAQLTANNGNLCDPPDYPNGTSSCQVYSTIYAVTTDGYVYQIDMHGLDPNGYIFYGNRVGLLDPDGKTPLYHDGVYTDNTLGTIYGGVTLPAATAKFYFNNPLLSDLPASILPTPVVPTIHDISYVGSAYNNTGYQTIGGTFTYTGNVGGISEVIISQDKVDFSPDNPLNRRLLSQSFAGSNSITWDGKDNQGVYFPVGTDYPFKIIFHAGEYHFPLIDAENSLLGGPTFTLLNPFYGVCPFNVNCHTAFYDDRMYRVVSTGEIVNTGYTQAQVNTGLTLLGDANATNPPTINHSDMSNGFDTSTAQRAFGDPVTPDRYGFGNWKTLDLWTYFPVPLEIDYLNVIDNATQDLGIVKSHTGGMFNLGSNGGSFNIRVSNTGSTPVSATTTTVTDTLPTGLTLYATPAGTGWTCTGNAGASSYSCSRADALAVGDYFPDITVNVNVTIAAAPSVTNTAYVAHTPDSNPSNNQSSDLVIVASPDLTVTKTDNTGGYGLLNIAFNWKLTVANTGTGAGTFAATQTIVRDPLPANATYGTPTVGSFVNITNPGNISCSIDGSKVLTCTASGAPVTIAAYNGSFAVTFSTTPTATGSLPNTATVDYGNNVPESNETNNTGSDTVTVSAAAAVISNFVWNDVNANGVQDGGGETGINGATVNLRDSTGNTILQTTTTAGGGLYSFTVAPGSYIVEFVPPSGYVHSPQDQGGNDATDSDASVSTGRTATVTVTAGQTNTSVDAGFYLGAVISNFVWADTNANGVQGADETGIAGATVRLRDSTGSTILQTTTTNSSGLYSFTAAPGSYIVEFVTPSGYVHSPQDQGGNDATDSDASVSNGRTATVTVTSGQTNDTVDAGFYQNATIGNFVWNDTDDNGIHDAGETGIAGATVNLRDSTGSTILQTTTTNSGGLYSFTVAPGTYILEFVTPTGGAHSPADQGGNDDLDSDASVTTGLTATYTLTSGQTNNSVDAGFNFTALTITKNSSVGGSANPGDTITYTIGVTNNTPTYQTGIAVTDALPSGTAYVANSTVANGYVFIYDNLSGGVSYTYTPADSAPWVGTGWIEVTEADGANAGSLRVRAADANCPSGGAAEDCIRITNGNATRSLYRAANLSACTSATLTYSYRNTLSGGGIAVQIYNGSATRTLVTYTNGNTGTGTDTYSLNSDELTANMRVVLNLVTATNTGNFVYFDDIRLACQASKDNSVGSLHPLSNGVPANLVVALDKFGLNPDQSMTVTFQATVSNPVSLTSIDNTASVVSTLQTSPQSASTSDLLPRATIGNSVWLDENGDGYQDAGEAGIANITVQLWNSGHTGSPLATTTTDTNGNYNFKNVAPGTYQVDVLNSSLPTGLVQTTVIGGSADFTNKADPYTLTVVAGSESMQADFGFNWSTVTETDTNTGTGVIGDRLWIDDGNGRQDPGEPGLAGVTVQLLTPGTDGIFGTSDDPAPVATATTDAAGNYIFDNLAAGVYKVRVNGGAAPSGYTQTGDPDQFGALCTTCDNLTTTPILLSPGDVYVNADFGYQPTAGNGGNIGDTLWVDSNRNNTVDTGEQRLAGVTVALIRDLNANGTWDAGEPVIATDITDTNGTYLFTNVPVTDGTGTDDYLVWVNDTENVLFPLVPTYDSNGVGTPNISAVANLTSAGNTDQDFAYAPKGHDAGEGLIGDTIFLDNNADGSYQTGEGLEGVRVQLYKDTNANGIYDAGEPLLASTLTSENGYYAFGGLAPGRYVVKIDTTSLPAGVTNTVDPGAVTPLNESGVNLSAGQINLAQDFGYRRTTTPNTIGGTLWRDTNANGVLDGTETLRFQNITVVLRNSSGNIVATTTTDASGNYSFGNLPDGTYTVHVSDDNNLLNGYWHSLGTAGLDNNSQVDPYTVTVTGGQTNTTADFGYYRDPAAVGDYVWLDRNNNGIQDSDEPGIRGLLVTLTATYPNGTSTHYSMLSGVDGIYSFGNLLLDEDFNVGDNTPSRPNYTITFATPPGTTPSPTGQGTPATDSNGTSTVANPIYKGQTDTTYDSGFYTLRLDLGDLPQSPYPTLFKPGPAHIVFPDTNSDGKPDTAGGVPAVWLGLTIDTEPNGQPSVYADGDGADEDGLTLASTGWIAGQSSTATVTINSSQSGTTVYYGLWIDWDNNGSLETFYNGSGVSGSPTPVSFSVSVPGSYVANTNVYMRVRASSAPLTSADYQGTLINGEVEDYLYQFTSGGVPTPVTLSYFLAQRQGDSVNFTWSTATETGNVGFNLYVKSGGQLTRINSQLIPSRVVDSLDRQDYSFSTQMKGDTFYIEDVSVLGETSRYGPFQIGEKYGNQLNADKIDWAAIQAENNNKNAERQDDLVQEMTTPAAAGKPVTVKPAATLTPTRTPTPGKTLTPTKTPTPTKTVKTTATSKPNMTVTPNKTPTPTRTLTPIKTATPTKTPTPTKTVETTATFKPTMTATPTKTVKTTAISKPTMTGTPTATPTPTAIVPSATVESTAIAESTATVEPTATPTPTAIEPSATVEPTATPTPTAIEPSATVESTAIAESTATNEPTAIVEPTATSTATNEPTATVEPTATSTVPVEPTATVEPSATPTATVEPTATPAPYATAVPFDPASLQLTTTFNLKVRQTGVYRVTYEMLRDAGLDLAGVPTARITVINRNLMVPVYVYVPGQAETFGPGGFIEFYGEALDTIYTDTNIYTVQVTTASVSQIYGTDAAPGLNLVSPISYTKTLVVNNQRARADYAPGADAWYDTSMFAYTTSMSWNFPFQVNGLVSSPATLELVVWGVTDWPQSPDHHLLASVNGVPVADQTFDGLVEKTLRINLPVGALNEGTNTLQLTLPGDTGVNYDMVNLDKFSLTYQSLFQAEDGRLTFTAAGDVFNVTNLPSANVVVYRMRNGGLMRLQNVNVQATGTSFTASFAGTNQADTYLATTAEALYTPVLKAARLKADLNRPAQYLIISHPDFIDGLQPLVQARQAQGLTVSVVDVNDLYTQYSYGIFDPQAIQKYIAYAARNLGTQYVLLVGGDTYDYRNYLGRNSISFIPSLYIRTGDYANFVPVDPLYADLNGDNVPDLAIGRFPVRTTAELNLMVSKTLAYAGKSYGRTAVFASDSNDGIVSFKDISSSLAASLPRGWSVENIHLDDMSVASARTQLLAAMNRGTALVTFTGHSGPLSWTFSNLFNTDDAAALTNAGRPFVVVQWGCWNTYYVDPVNNYLVQKLLFSGDQGAAAVLGASTLTDSGSEELLGELLTPRLVTAGMPIGQALQDAKSELAQAHPGLLDVLLGWSLMGDPALMVEP